MENETSNGLDELAELRARLDVAEQKLRRQDFLPIGLIDVRVHKRRRRCVRSNRHPRLRNR